MVSTQTENRSMLGSRMSQRIAMVALALALGRPASDAEVSRDVQLLGAFRAKDGLSPEDALKYYCLMILNSNEFVYLD